MGEEVGDEERRDKESTQDTSGQTLPSGWVGDEVFSAKPDILLTL